MGAGYLPCIFTITYEYVVLGLQTLEWSLTETSQAQSMENKCKGGSGLQN